VIASMVDVLLNNKALSAKIIYIVWKKMYRFPRIEFHIRLSRIK
jgi:hypothetical protein